MLLLQFVMSEPWRGMKGKAYATEVGVCDDVVINRIPGTSTDIIPGQQFVVRHSI